MTEFSEIKDLLVEQQKAFDAFKAANDSRLAQVEKGAEDAVTADEVKKINDALDGIADKIKEARARQDEMEARLNRPGATGGGDATEAKAITDFNMQRALSAAAKQRPAPSPLDTDGYREYLSAFNAYVRRGPDESWGDAERKALSVGQDPAGGYLVTPDMSGRMVSKIFESSPIRQIASVQTISTDSLEGALDLDEAAAGWVGETGSRSETGTPDVGEWKIPAHEQYAAPKVTQKLLDDTAINIEQWLADKVSGKLARSEATAFVTGNGVLKPRGFLDYPTAATADASRAWGTVQHVATGTSGGWGTAPNGSDKLVDLVHSLKAAYRSGAVFVMNRATVGSIRKLKADNQYIWLPSMIAGQPSSLIGYGVTEAEDMPDVGADSLSVAFGDFRAGYQIVDRQGVRTLRDPYTAKPYVVFYTTRRVGGALLDSEAIKILKFGS
jgi:HK97 family phage major capsid protein